MNHKRRINLNWFAKNFSGGWEEVGDENVWLCENDIIQSDLPNMFPIFFVNNKIIQIMIFTTY